MLFADLPGAERCGVMHPFFPHLTNKLWEVPTKGAVTGANELKIVRKFLAGLGMNLIEVADVPAFAADRLFCGMMLEAVRIHVELGLSPAQVDDVCKRTLGTSPFFVHNLIAGANYLSAHCMELMQGEVDSSLFAIPKSSRAAHTLENAGAGSLVLDADDEAAIDAAFPLGRRRRGVPTL